jgi:hypothetical protein
MTGKEFLNSIAKGKKDFLQQFVAILAETGSRYCVIGGLAVNAYVEPVVSLDIDIVVAVHDIETVMKAADNQRWKIETFEHSIYVSASGSDLRVQIQTDPRYQGFIAGGELRNILGYDLQVATLEDVLQGKVWAYSAENRRRSKRQKDLADIMRIIEAFPELALRLPSSLKERLEKE